MDWKIAFEIAGLLGGVATVLAFFLVPALYLGAKIDAFRRDIQAEMKDFHTRLLKIEERNRGK
ncbi:hypothetical protein LCGC14_0457120 [marine sediment metagenome]|uniref:Uncharacterized protein n=1 Tax=marine sediment metagenome TaxID=412755 RepID=A0A0F9SGD0_9ZZZZ